MVQLKIDPLYRTPEIVKKLQDFEIQESEQSDLVLSWSKKDNWCLKDSEDRKLEINFDQNRRDYHRTHKGSGELIARALGIKDDVETVVDLTAGLGIDSVFLAQLGFSVISLERNPILAFLLQEAQGKTSRAEVRAIQFKQASAVDFLSSFKIEGSVSCYFDPMFPEKKKTALPRQEMVVFRNMVGDDEDALETLEAALKLPFSRVVVKRPLRSPVIKTGPAFQLTSKLLRYDVYYPKSQKVGESS